MLAVTYRCDGRCIMCGIWKGDRGEELPADAYARLPSSLRYVNLSGGEPFLREDLPEIVSRVREACPRADTVISTNGLRPGSIEVLMRDILERDPGIGVAVSIDGVGPRHDEIRGVDRAYERATDTLQRLKSLGMKNLRVAFTVVGRNALELNKVYDLSREWGVEFTCAVAHQSSHYFRVRREQFVIQTDLLRDQLRQVARREIATLSPKCWARAYFLAGLYRFARGEERRLPCYAAEDFFFMAPAGDIHGCSVLASPMGNLGELAFDEIWRSDRADAARRAVQLCREHCWMICTARTAMLRHRWRVLGWVLRHKLLPKSAFG